MTITKNKFGAKARLCDWCGDLCLPDDAEGWSVLYVPEPGVDDVEDMDSHDLCADCTYKAGDSLRMLRRKRGNSAVANIRDLYKRACERTSTDPIAFEQQCLSIGRELVPAHSWHALVGNEPQTHVERIQHYRWLLNQLNGGV